MAAKGQSMETRNGVGHPSGVGRILTGGSDSTNVADGATHGGGSTAG